MWERCVSADGSGLSDFVRSTNRDLKNSSWEEEGINALCQLIGLWVTESLGGGIDSRKEIDLLLLQYNWGKLEIRLKNVDDLFMNLIDCILKQSWR